MDNPIAISSFQGSASSDDEFMQIVTDNTTYHEKTSAVEFDVDMLEIDSSEIAAIVCGVPVMISNCDQDIDMREKELTSFDETNLIKDSTNMELDMSLNTKDMIEASDCEIQNKMNKFNNLNLSDNHIEKNYGNMEVELLENKNAIKIFNTDDATKGDVKENTTVVYKALEKDKVNIETAVTYNKNTAKVLNIVTDFDITTEVQETKDTVLQTAHLDEESTKMEMENDISEKNSTVLTSSPILIDTEKQKEMNLYEKSENSSLDVSARGKEMHYMSGDTYETEKQAAKATFYAVALPGSFLQSENVSCIFTSKVEALAAIKKYPGARFMQFDSIEDAIQYSSKPLPQFTLLTPVEDKSSKYRSITSQQMVALRKSIEKGDEASFLDTVWSNPRYLINNAGDGPTVMQEGTRYNALHVAARFKQSAMFLTILNTIQDFQFMSLLYPQEEPQMIENRISRLVDLYLNTPDKSLSETPLHFACKYGADEILSILLSYRECDIYKKNKYGQTPREMICDRTCHHPELKQRMNLMFEDQFYVPILRDLQNNIQEPVIGKPCHKDVFLTSTSSELAYGEKNLVYCAFAGPMTEYAADNFYTLLKKRKFNENLSFTPEEKKQLVDIRLSDSEKGLERVARKLAKELDVGWIEFWPSLQFWGDLSNEGLEFLEKKLKNHYEKTKISPKNKNLMANKCEDLVRNSILVFVDDFVQRFPEIMKNKSKMTFCLLFQSLLPHLLCLTKSTFHEAKELYMIHGEIGRLLYLKLIYDYKEYFDDFRFYLNKQFHTLDNLFKFHASDAWKMFICILKNMSYNPFSDIKSLKPPKCGCKWKIQQKFFYSSYFVHKFILNEIEKFRKASAGCKSLIAGATSLSSSYTKSEEKDNAIVVPFQNLSLENFSEITNSGGLAKEQIAQHFPENASEDIFYLPNDSIEIEDDKNILNISGDSLIRVAHNNVINSSLEDTDDELEGFYTPPESPVLRENQAFIKGINAFSDVDIDIFRAIVDGGATINRKECPNVFEWKCSMESKLKALLNPHDKLSCTPASSSASIRRAITPVNRVRRTLF